MLASHGRYPCAPWKDRPDFQWPDGKRLAVSLAVVVFPTWIWMKITPCKSKP